MINAIHRYMVVAFRVFAVLTFVLGAAMFLDGLYGWSYDWSLKSLAIYALQMAGGLWLLWLVPVLWRVSEFERRFVK